MVESEEKGRGRRRNWRVRAGSGNLCRSRMCRSHAVISDEKVPPIGHCIALYDYDRQTSEEITFREASRITIYDKEDPDWYLVSCGTEYGFAPSNYLEESGIGGQSPAVIAQQQPNSHASYHALPPPIHGSASDHSDDYDHHQKIYPHGRDSIAAISELAPPIVSNINASRSTPDHVDHTLLEETRESLPANSKRPQLPDRATSQAAPDFQAQSRPTPRPFRTWSVQEVDGKKKKRGGTFGVGNMELSYAPGSSKVSNLIERAMADRPRNQCRHGLSLHWSDMPPKRNTYLLILLLHQRQPLTTFTPDQRKLQTKSVLI